MEGALLQLFVLFTASAIAVPFAKKIGLGSVLGYLIAGIIIGPYGLSLLADVETLMHFTEFGVVIMLFLVGLELKPSLLWEMRAPIFGMGGMQVLLTALATGLFASIFVPWEQATAIGLILALSSTALVLQTLKEKGLFRTPSGQSIFSVLLFQDLAVIPMLALLPLLGNATNQEIERSTHSFIEIDILPWYSQLIVIILSIVLVFMLGRYASRPIFRVIAGIRMREIFVAAALAMLVGISLLMTEVGLSPALGAFLAGVVLADSEYRHELLSDIEPFKGLLLGVFFISIGASLNFQLISQRIGMILGISFGLILIKVVLLYIVASIFKMTKKNRVRFSVMLAQGGEFAFVLFQFTRANGILGEKIVEPLIASVAISMFLAPIFIRVCEIIVSKRQIEVKREETQSIEETGHRIILAGFGKLGMDIGRFLMSAGEKVVIIDHDAANVDMLRKFGFEVYYGDVTRLDLLEAAGAREAELIIIALGEREITLKMVEMVKKHFPNMKIVANAEDMSVVYELMDYKVDNVRRKTFGTALTMGQDALMQIGMDPYEAYRLKRVFRKHNEELIKELYEKNQDDFNSYEFAYHEKLKDIEKLMTLELEMQAEEIDSTWSGRE